MLKLALHFGNARQVPELQPYIYRTTKYFFCNYNLEQQIKWQKYKNKGAHL